MLLKRTFAHDGAGEERSAGGEQWRAGRHSVNSFIRAKCTMNNVFPICPLFAIMYTIVYVCLSDSLCLFAFMWVACKYLRKIMFCHSLSFKHCYLIMNRNLGKPISCQSGWLMLGLPNVATITMAFLISKSFLIATATDFVCFFSAMTMCKIACIGRLNAIQHRSTENQPNPNWNYYINEGSASKRYGTLILLDWLDLLS